MSSAQLNKPSKPTTSSSDESKAVETSPSAVVLSAPASAHLLPPVPAPVLAPILAPAPAPVHAPAPASVVISNGSGHKSQPSSPPAPASGDKKEKKQRAALYSENVPTFYCGSGNNSEL